MTSDKITFTIKENYIKYENIYKREREREKNTQKNIEHTRVGVAMINTEQDNSNIVLF